MGGMREAVAATAATISIVAVEEHLVLPCLQKAWRTLPGFRENPNLGFGDAPLARRLRSTGSERIADMDDQGVRVQVLSSTTPGVNDLEASLAVAVSRDFNDGVADVVAADPDRFRAFATLPMQSPEAAAEELDRCVRGHGFCGAMLFGRVGDVKPEDRRYDVLYATAASLGVPLHFHPQAIPVEVQNAYYGGLGDALSFEFANPGIGWYYDLGVQFLRMMLTGVFDRHPDLQVVMGHWGEVVLFYLDHAQYLQQRVSIERPFADILRQNVWVAGSGTQSDRYMRWAAEVVGVDRLLSSTDYPFTFRSGFDVIETGAGEARALIERSAFSKEEKVAIASGNWNRLLASAAARWDSKG